MKANSIPQKAILKTHCDIIANSAKEIKALLGYDDNTIALNYTRLKTDIECIKNSVSELEISYIK